MNKKKGKLLSKILWTILIKIFKSSKNIQKDIWFRKEKILKYLEDKISNNIYFRYVLIIFLIAFLIVPPLYFWGSGITGFAIYQTMDNGDNITSYIEIQPNATEGIDCYIREDNPNNNYPSTRLLTGDWVNGDFNSFMEFNLSDLNGKTITQANLTVYTAKGMSNNLDVEVHRMITDWNESATWYTKDGLNNWITSGGDYDATVEDSQSVPWTSNTPVIFDLTDLTKGWVNGSYSNYGLILKKGAINNDYTIFWCSDQGTTTKPKLSIMYTTVDITPPTINLIEPSNASIDFDGLIFFQYNVTDPSGTVSSCKLIVNGVVKETNTSITEDIVQNFSKIGLLSGTYEWGVNCTSENGENVSETWTLTVPSAIFEDTFTSPGGFENNSDNRAPWQRGNVTQSPINRCYDDAYCWGTNLTGNYYPIGPYDDYLTQVNSIDFTNYNELILWFYHYRYLEDATALWDAGVVDIDYNGSWTRLTPNEGYTGIVSNIAGNSLGFQQAYGLHSSNWELATFNLTPYAGNSSVKIRFYFATDQAASDVGWFIDKLRVAAVTLVNPSPTVTMDAPVNNSYINVNYTLLNATVYDSNLDEMTVWFYGDGTLLTTFYNQTNGTTLIYNWTSLSEGSHNWTIIANDGTSNNVNEYYYFTVDTITHQLIISHPINGTSYKLHYYNINLDLNYTVTNGDTPHCWFTNLTGQNEILSDCNNGTINIPNQIDDNYYNITVYVNDSTGNINSNQIFFTTDYSQGIMDETTIEVPNSAIVQVEAFNINSSSTCINDWCENVTTTLIYNTRDCELRPSYETFYNKGDIDQLNTILQIWEAICNVIGTYTFKVNYTVQNNSVDFVSQSIFLSPTELDFEIDSLVAGSPRYPNEEVLNEATFTDQKGTAIEPDAINLTIYDNNNNIWDTATKSDFSENPYHVWKYSKSIGSNPPTGMYSINMLATYNDMDSSKTVQFRVATGGPYKVFLECPSMSYVGQDLNCKVILQDEGEAPTESTSIVWIDTNNDGIIGASEPQISFSKQTTPKQNITQTVLINIPLIHPTGLYVVRVDTSYANSAQPNSGASDSVIFNTIPVVSKGAHNGGVPIKEEITPIIGKVVEGLLFDVGIRILDKYKEILAGDSLAVEINLYNVGERVERRDTLVIYFIKGSEGNIIISESETVAINTKTSFVKEFLVPKNLEPAEYLFVVEIKYNGQVATSSSGFKIIEEVPIRKALQFPKINWQWATMFVLIVLVILGFCCLIIKLNKHEKLIKSLLLLKNKISKKKQIALLKKSISALGTLYKVGAINEKNYNKQKERFLKKIQEIKSEKLKLF